MKFVNVTADFGYWTFYETAKNNPGRTFKVTNRDSPEQLMFEDGTLFSSEAEAVLCARQAQAEMDSEQRQWESERNTAFFESEIYGSREYLKGVKL